MAGEINIEVPKPEKLSQSLPSPEKGVSPEISAERPAQSAEKAPETLKAGEAVPTASVSPAPALLSYQEQRAQAIDTILSEGLNDIYLKMDPGSQRKFREGGEETVKKINVLMEKTKVKAGKIIDLIKAWLKMIPGVNRFFLEQEAKIKADKIMRIKDTL